MIEKIEIGTCLSELPNGSTDKIVGTSGKNAVNTTPAKIIETGGCGVLNLGNLTGGKWYRIAVGDYGNRPSSALLNIGKAYSVSIPTHQLLYVSADAYNTGAVATNIANIRKGIGQLRVLYKNSSAVKVLLDIYISESGSNIFFLAYSNNLGFVFQQPVEVSGTPDVDYLVKEFSF